MTVLFLSPHLDDVALSASLAVEREVARGERVVVATFFTESHDGPARRAEDCAAMEVLGAEPVHVGLLDFPERRGVAPSFAALCVDRDEEAEAREREDVGAALGALLGALAPSRVFLPLGVGGHVDHRLVAALAPRLARFAHAFYEDFPYAMVGPWLDAALGRPVAIAPADLHEAIRAALPGFGAEEADAARLASRLAIPAPSPARGLAEEVLVPTPQSLARKLDAVARYRSQSAVALGDRTPSALFARHARATSSPPGAERLWWAGAEPDDDDGALV